MTNNVCRLFMVVVDKPLDIYSDAFTKFLASDKAYGYWHWMAHVWVIADHYMTNEAQSWRLKMERYFPGHNMFVVEITGASAWSARAPIDGHPWLAQYMNGKPTL